jgi:hypothetical protein
MDSKAKDLLIACGWEAGKDADGRPFWTDPKGQADFHIRENGNGEIAFIELGQVIHYAEAGNHFETLREFGL